MMFLQLLVVLVGSLLGPCDRVVRGVGLESQEYEVGFGVLLWEEIGEYQQVVGVGVELSEAQEVEIVVLPDHHGDLLVGIDLGRTLVVLDSQALHAYVVQDPVPCVVVGVLHLRGSQDDEWEPFVYLVVFVDFGVASLGFLLCLLQTGENRSRRWRALRKSIE